MSALFKHVGKDLSASIVVVFCGLCHFVWGSPLEVVLPLFSGLISGIIRWWWVVGVISGIYDRVSVGRESRGLAVIYYCDRTLGELLKTFS